MTSISTDFRECNLSSKQVIEALKSGDQAAIDQVASKLYSSLLGVASDGFQDALDSPQKDEKLKWTLHTLVAVFGGILKTDDLVGEVQADNYEDISSLTDLGYELKFLLLDLLGLYYELNYSTWNLINFFAPPGRLDTEQVTRFLEPAVQPPPHRALIVAQEQKGDGVLRQALTNWDYWCQTYKTLMTRAYNAHQNDSAVAFHGLLTVSGHLISAAHVGSLLLFSRARSITADHVARN